MISALHYLSSLQCTVIALCFTFLFFFKMLLSDINCKNTSPVQLDVTGTKTETDSDNDDSEEDTLEAEISKLERTINDLEANNDLPNVHCHAYDLGEDEILDSMLFEEGGLANAGIFKRNEITVNNYSHNGTFSNCDDNIDGGMLDSGRMSQNANCNKGDKHTSSELNEFDGTPNTPSHEKKSEPDSSKRSKTLEARSVTVSYQECVAEHQKNDRRLIKGSTCQPELKIPKENVFNPMKSVIISNNHESVSLRSQDCELSTNVVKVHLNSINRTDITSSDTTCCGTKAERNKICPVETDKDSTAVIRSSSLVDVDAVIHASSQESFLQIDVSEIEDGLLYAAADNDGDGGGGGGDDDVITPSFSEIEDNEPLVSSTPFKIKAEPLKRRKPPFLPVKESFLLLDDSGESSDQEHSVCTYKNSSVPKVSTTHSTQPTSFTHNSLFFKVKASNIADVREGGNDTGLTQVASGEGTDLKVVLKLRDEVNEDDHGDGLQSSSCVKLSPVFTNATPIQGHHGEDNTEDVPEENILDPNFPPEGTDENSPEQKPNIISKRDDYVSNNPQENEDNNNPEWELLRKLETDEERYRAVRRRWRNLIIPDPNKDLTYRSWRIRQNATKLPASASTSKNAVAGQISAIGSDTPSSMQQDQCKRTVSDEQASSQCQPRVKRPRTQFCTAIFDAKLEQLRRNIEYEKQQIYNQERVALLQLSMKQREERNFLQNLRYTHGVNTQMHQLYFRQRGVGIFWYTVECSFQ
jgi:hypothetical protein